MRGTLFPVLILTAVLASAMMIAEAWPSGRETPSDAPPQEAEKPQPPQRVIIRVNRNREVTGRVELEDDDVIVVRTEKGEVESFFKSRVRQIVRLVDPEPEQRGVVVMKSGQRRGGVILEDTFDHVTMEIEGVRTRLRREHVDYVTLEPTFDEQYRELKASIGPGMYDRHLMLCRWLIERRRYELAQENLLELLDRIDPRRATEVERLLRIVEAQLELIRASEQRRATGNETDPDPESDDTTAKPTFDSGRILTRDEVNLIRVFEIDFEHPPRLQVPPATIRALINEYATNPHVPTDPRDRDALLSADPIQIVRLMFELRARELYSQVEVLSEPRSLNLFRQRVHNTWLLNHCATSGCHGGPNAGRLFLHRDGYKDERVRYTNFLILERLEVDSQWPLINYSDPELSLILQHGLPREQARLPHPDVPDWRPLFGPTNERVRQDALEWISAMMTPRPDYPIDYTPPDPTAEPPEDDLGEDSSTADPAADSGADAPDPRS